MKIIVLSDSHGDIEKAEKVISKNRDADLIIHLGDYFRDAQQLADKYPLIPMEYIYGNSDFMIGDVPSEKLLVYEGKKIFITHGHRYSVKWDYDNICKKAEETGADVLLFGHTHVAEVIDRGNYKVINPGSISDSRDGKAESYALIRINGEDVEAKLCYV